MKRNCLYIIETGGIMKRYFVNFTNHPMKMWDEKQKHEAEQYGEIIDLRFPNVEAEGDEEYIEQLAGECVEKILEYQPCAVLCQGEFSLSYQVILRLKEKGIRVMAACSKRMVRELENKKEVTFVFERFRFY